MATLPLNADGAGARPDTALLDRWTQVGLALVVLPLVLWGGFSVGLFAEASGVEGWLAILPALGTSGVMLVSTLVSLQPSLSAPVRRYATALAALSVGIEIIISGLRHAMADPFDPGFWGAFTIAALPSLMGGATMHLIALVVAQGRRERTARHVAELAATTQADQRRRSLAEAEATAERNRLTAERERTEELAHAVQLAELAERTATAAQRQTAAVQTVAAAITPTLRSVPPPAPDGPVDALGRKARPSEKRDAALRWLLAQHRDGRDLRTVTGAEVDRVIGANAYAKKHLAKWVPDVIAYAKGRAA